MEDVTWIIRLAVDLAKIRYHRGIIEKAPRLIRTRNRSTHFRNNLFGGGTRGLGANFVPDNPREATGFALLGFDVITYNKELN
ncbi:hypothetical protein TNCV_757441 [Trichonephila clavipes]|nr:hypothetical protein TNCV_757441 [Trichonephila clavipes]